MHSYHTHCISSSCLPEPIDPVARDHVDQVHASVCNVKDDAFPECCEVCLQLLQQLWVGVAVNHTPPSNHTRIPATAERLKSPFLSNNHS